MKELFRALAGLEIDLPYSGRTDGLYAQLVWQFLRFNSDYRTGYDCLSKSGDDSGEPAMFFAQSWCLSTAVDYRHESLPVERYVETIKGMRGIDDTVVEGSLSPYFDYKPVRKMPKWKHVKEWGEVFYPADRQLLVVNPYAHPRQVASFLENITPTKEFSMRDLRVPQLVEYIICHHYLHVHRMGPTEFSPIYHEVFHPLRTDTLQTASLKKKVEGFHKIVELTPWCFFTPPHH